MLSSANPPDDGQYHREIGFGELDIWVAVQDHAGYRRADFRNSDFAGWRSNVQRYSATVPALNTWNHVAGVYNASARTLEIYVNGVLDNGVLLGTVPSAQFDPNLSVSIGKRNTGYYFDGTIDEVKVYNRALSQAEIQGDMNTSSVTTSNTPPTIALLSPSDGANYAAPAVVMMGAGVTTNGHTIGSVQFLTNGTLLGAVAAAPYNFTASNLAFGTYMLTARLVYDGGSTWIKRLSASRYWAALSLADCRHRQCERWRQCHMSNGVYTVNGAGTLSGTADKFRFVYQGLSGSGEMTAASGR